MIKKKQSSRLSQNVVKNSNSVEFDFNDLSRLHWLALSRKALNILEIGSGFSTVIFSDACNILSYYFKELTFSRKFHIFS